MTVQFDYQLKQFFEALKSKHAALSWGHARKSDLLWIETVYRGYALRISYRVPEEHEDFVVPTYYGMGTGTHVLSFEVQLRDLLQRSGRKHIIKETVYTESELFESVRDTFEEVRRRTPVHFQGRSARVSPEEALGEAIEELLTV